MTHDVDALKKLPTDARIYVQPSGWVEGPYADPAAARGLAGGLVSFSAVVFIARHGMERVASVHVSLKDVPLVISGLSDGHRERANRQVEALLRPAAVLELAGGRKLQLDRPHIMGILNITPDSFSDGGQNLAADSAIAHAHAMTTHGASLIDIGGESTRPGAKPVWEGDEIARVTPVLNALRSSGTLMSIDTRKASVMRAALNLGAHLINDVSGLSYDPESLATVAECGAPVVVMHAQGDPQDMQKNPHYHDALLDIFDWLEKRLDACVAAGIPRERIILDPGIGFGKSVRHNLDVLNGISLFHALGQPLLVGVSRKRFIGALSREEAAHDRLGGSLAAMCALLSQGAQILRVHDVAPSVQAMKIWRGLRDAALTPRIIG
jgi:dihydropteroate synthase